MHDELEEVAETKRQRFSLLSNIWHHDLTNRLKMRRVSDAKTMGLGDDYPVGTYPSHPATIVNHHQSSPLVPILLSALLGGGGVMGGMALFSSMGTPPVPPVTPSVQTLSPIEFDIEILGTEDGIEANVLSPDD
jgi:hypothetical protein